MKRNIKVLCLILTMVLLAAAPGYNNAGALDDVPGAVIRIDTGYYKISDYNAGKVPEIHTGAGASDFNGYTRAADGFYIMQWSDRPNSAGTAGSIAGSIAGGGKTVIKIPVVKKYDNSGKLLWTKSYDLPYLNGGTGKLAAYMDGFVLTVEQWPSYYDSQLSTLRKGYVLRCDKNGGIQWKKEIEDYSGEMFGNIIVTAEQNIVTVGTWMYKDGKQVMGDAANDIVFMKFSQKGEVLAQKSFGGSGFESSPVAAYSKDAGLVVNYYCQTIDSTGNRITCFDADLKEKWTYKAKDREFPESDKFAVSGGFIYQAGVKYPKTVGGQHEYSFLKLDKTGKVVWSTQGTSKSIAAVTVLSSGNIAVSGVEGKNKDKYISIIDGNNRTLHKVSGKNYVADTIYQTSDGGFVTVAVRAVKTIPQPAYISSIWYDYETVAAKYDKNLKLVWRKTYNKYKDTIQRDFVYADKGGKLWIE